MQTTTTRLDNKLGFGLMRLPLAGDDPTGIDLDSLETMVDLYLRHGGRYFDTSPVYHRGRSEAAARRALVERHPRDSYLLASKMPDFYLKSEDEVERVFQEQLRQCGVDHFDSYLIHNVNELLYREPVSKFHLFEHALKWKDAGRIRRLGLSFHDSAEVLDAILTEHPEIEFVQIVLNYYDWEAPFIQSRRCYEVIRKHGKDVVAMQPVKAGMLADVPERVGARMRALHPDWSPAAWALRFAAGQDGVIAALSGMSTPEQVLDNVSAMRDAAPLTPEETALLEEAAAAFRANWKIRCDDWRAVDAACPKGIPIAAILAAYNSILLQPHPYGGAELNYYRNYVSRRCPAEACDHCGRCGSVCGGADIERFLAEAARFETEHAFPESRPAYDGPWNA